MPRVPASGAAMGEYRLMVSRRPARRHAFLLGCAIFALDAAAFKAEGLPLPRFRR
jgi:hypothetical protein